MTDLHEDPQWERARQSWELVVNLAPAADSDPRHGDPRMRWLIRVLRIKRSERAELWTRLPGVVRRGARVDLLPIAEALREGSVPCELRRRVDDPSPR
ncbi:MAG TPA: hypothetical protein VKA74_04900 [Myxococcota bacterium]|nr:hypothetical protein [Myxococcota bacterium]